MADYNWLKICILVLYPKRVIYYSEAECGVGIIKILAMQVIVLIKARKIHASQLNSLFLTANSHNQTKNEPRNKNMD